MSITSRLRLKKPALRSFWVTFGLLFVGWTSLFSAMYVWEVDAEHEKTLKSIKLKAELLADNIQTLQNWIGGHGGIYVPISDDDRPNPLLTSIPDRDITTPSGKQLTLYNSPAFLRVLYNEFEALTGTRVRLTSQHPLNTNNKPDEWESKALERLSDGSVQISGAPPHEKTTYYRLLRPMILQENCLSCHNYPESKLGKPVGAISVKYDTSPDYAAHRGAEQVLTASHATLWLSGALALVGVGRWWWLMLLRLDRSATRDELTGLCNRQALMSQFSLEIDRTARYATPLSVLMLDIDHFKYVNDSYGHLAGDAVLKSLSELLQRTVRSSDIVGRYGGEEILIVCPNTSMTTALQLAERIRSTVEQMPISTGAEEIYITVSIGAGDYTPDNKTANVIIKEADEALYEAKNNGRNRVCYRR